jgi:hypothetical protein
LFSVQASLLHKQSFLLLYDLSLTEFNGVFVREARQIEAIPHYFDNSVAISIKQIGRIERVIFGVGLQRLVPARLTVHRSCRMPYEY